MARDPGAWLHLQRISTSRYARRFPCISCLKRFRLGSGRGLLFFGSSERLRGCVRLSVVSRFRAPGGGCRRAETHTLITASLELGRGRVLVSQQPTHTPPVRSYLTSERGSRLKHLLLCFECIELPHLPCIEVRCHRFHQHRSAISPGFARCPRARASPSFTVLLSLQRPEH